MNDYDVSKLRLGQDAVKLPASCLRALQGAVVLLVEKFKGKFDRGRVVDADRGECGKVGVEHGEDVAVLAGFPAPRGVTGECLVGLVHPGSVAVGGSDRPFRDAQQLLAVSRLAAQRGRAEEQYRGDG